MSDTISLTAADIDSAIDTFYEIVENQEPEIACECNWHGTEWSPGSITDSPAEWIVNVKAFCCAPSKSVLWCDACLTAYLAYEGPVNCVRCAKTYDVVCRLMVTSFEPLHPTRDAA